MPGFERARGPTGREVEWGGRDLWNRGWGLGNVGGRGAGEADSSESRDREMWNRSLKPLLNYSALTRCFKRGGGDRQPPPSALPPSCTTITTTTTKHLSPILPSLSYFTFSLLPPFISFPTLPHFSLFYLTFSTISIFSLPSSSSSLSSSSPSSSSSLSSSSSP